MNKIWNNNTLYRYNYTVVKPVYFWMIVTGTGFVLGILIYDIPDKLIL